VAIRDFTQAIALNPGYADAHFNLGIAYEGRGNHRGALAAYEAARLYLQKNFYHKESERPISAIRKNATGAAAD
jgi:tetratricopeptide (TPR) repeat protein